MDSRAPRICFYGKGNLTVSMFIFKSHHSNHITRWDILSQAVWLCDLIAKISFSDVQKKLNDSDISSNFQSTLLRKIAEKDRKLLEFSRHNNIFIGEKLKILHFSDFLHSQRLNDFP